MRFTPLIIALGLVFTVTGRGPSTDTASEAHACEIAWRDADVDDALAEAKDAGKPVLLCRGAAWCPPCNQMKATPFKDPAFIAA